MFILILIDDNIVSFCALKNVTINILFFKTNDNKRILHNSKFLEQLTCCQIQKDNIPQNTDTSDNIIYNNLVQ